MISITVVSARPDVPDEDFEVEEVPRIGETVQTQGMAVARVTDVIRHLTTGWVTVYAG